MIFADQQTLEVFDGGADGLFETFEAGFAYPDNALIRFYFEENPASTHRFHIVGLDVRNLHALLLSAVRPQVEVLFAGRCGARRFWH